MILVAYNNHLWEIPRYVNFQVVKFFHSVRIVPKKQEPLSLEDKQYWILGVSLEVLEQQFAKTMNLLCMYS